MTTSLSKTGNGKSIDTLLGERSRRYFGDGFRQGLVRFRSVNQSDDVDASTRCTGFAAVTYPAPWSMKASGAQNIHVSTIDTYLLAVSAASALLDAGARRRDQPLGSAWVRRCVIKAGNAPIEQGLDRIPISAKRIDAADDPVGRMHVISVTVGNMLVTLEVDSGTTVRPQSTIDLPRTYQTTATDLTDVTVAPDCSQVSATVTYAEGPGRRESFPEIESRFPEFLTFAEAFADMLQLGQVGLYTLDGFARAHSNTLWMRNTHFEATSPLRPREDGERITTEIRSPRIVTMKGRNWRIATLRSRRSSMTLSCSVAHTLPEVHLGKVGQDDSASSGVSTRNRRLRSGDSAHQ